MRYPRAVLALGALFAGTTSAIVATEGSPCASSCGNSLDHDGTADVVCVESEYTTNNAGVVFENCVTCESGSTFTSNTSQTVQSDLQAMYYNIRYTVDFCLMSEDGTNGALGNNPCMTETACGHLNESIATNLNNPDADMYDYCDTWNDEFLFDCTNCLRATDNGYILANFFDTLSGGCLYQPPGGVPLNFEGNMFSTDDLNITGATPSASIVPQGPAGPLNTADIVGVVFGGLAIILIAAGCGVVCVGKRRRRSYLREREERMRTTNAQWPSPQTGEMLQAAQTPVSTQGASTFRDWGNDTPVSQRGLRPAWGDSPVSAHTDATFPRYFSPYSSQFNSPVNGPDGVSNLPWPQQEGAMNIGMALTPDNERELQMQHLQMLQQQERQQLAFHLQQQRAMGSKGKDAMVSETATPNSYEQQFQYQQHGQETYEMQEGVHEQHVQQQQQQQQQQYYYEQQNQTPMLNHPGYGRGKA